MFILDTHGCSHTGGSLGKTRVRQINQSSVHLSLHAPNASPCNPPVSQLGPNVRPFQSQSGQIFVPSLLPMHLTLTRLIALCTGQKCYLLVYYRCQKRGSLDSLNMNLDREREKRWEGGRRITYPVLFDKGLTNPPPACKNRTGCKSSHKISAVSPADL